MRLTGVLGASHIWQGVLFAIDRTIILKLCATRVPRMGCCIVCIMQTKLFCPYFWPTFTKSAFL